MGIFRRVVAEEMGEQLGWELFSAPAVWSVQLWLATVGLALVFGLSFVLTPPAALEPTEIAAAGGLSLVVDLHVAASLHNSSHTDQLQMLTSSLLPSLTLFWPSASLQVVMDEQDR